MNLPAPIKVTVSKRFPAPAENVIHAWLDPDGSTGLSDQVAALGRKMPDLLDGILS